MRKPFYQKYSEVDLSFFEGKKKPSADSMSMFPALSVPDGMIYRRKLSFRLFWHQTSYADNGFAYYK